MKFPNKHKWKLFVRCANRRKYKASNFIEKMEFELHPTFKNPQKVRY